MVRTPKYACRPSRFCLASPILIKLSANMWCAVEIMTTRTPSVIPSSTYHTCYLIIHPTIFSKNLLKQATLDTKKSKALASINGQRINRS
uniref:10 kDa protein n=1 Tax=Autographa californica nuclear polyhedrosis virus TaxID=46015 RepID=Q64799_NPVAC|nr:10 kDa protein [Autographa californica nucleopolyhedrovirus]